MASALALSGCNEVAQQSSGPGADPGIGQSPNQPSAQAPTGNSNQPGAGPSEAVKKDPVTIQWLGTQNPHYFEIGIETDRVALAIAEKTGVIIDWSLNSGVADTDTKLMIALAGDDLPDIVTPVNASKIEGQLINSGQILELDDLIEQYAPNIVKNCAPMLTCNRLLRSEGSGKIYGINMQSRLVAITPDSGGNLWHIRWDLYKQLGCPEIKSLDDMLELMAAMRELEPETPDGQKTYGMGMFLGESWGAGLINRAYSFDVGVGGGGGTATACVSIYDNSSTLDLVDPDGMHWTYMEFANKAYRMDLLDPEALTIKFGAFIQKAEQQRYHVLLSNPWAGQTNQKAQNQGGNKGYVPITIPVNPKGFWYTNENYFGTAVGSYISAKSKYAVEIIQLLDYFATDEGRVLLLNGIEGVDWEWNEQGQGVVIGEALEALKTNTPIIKESGIDKYNWNLLTYANPVLENGTFVKFQFNTPVDQPVCVREYCEYYGVKTISERLMALGGRSYDFTLMAMDLYDLNTPVGVKNSNITNYYNTRSPGVIASKTEKDFQDAKAAMIKEYLDLGAEEVYEYFLVKWTELLERYGQLD